MAFVTDRSFAITVVRKLQDAGFTAYWAGGCVRDELLGLTPADYDVATNATPEAVQTHFRHTVAIGASFGVIEVIGPKIDGQWLKVQVATFRRDGHYSDGRRPDAVVYSTAEEDAQRRDFTINGMFFDPIAQQLIDFVGGQHDLNAKVLRAIGDPTARFEEDKLRVLRAVRMATRFQLAIDAATLAAAKAMAPQISAVSAERIAEELRKLLAHPQRFRGLQLLREFGLLPFILPEVVPDFDDALKTVAHLPEQTPFIPVLATLLRHQAIATAKRIARRLKLSNDETEFLAWILAKQPQLHEPLTPSRVYPILARPGREHLLAVARAIALVTGQHLDAVTACEEIVRTTPLAKLNPPTLLTGDDLIANGWVAGPRFKTVLEAVRAAQLDGLINDAAQAYEHAQRH